MKNIIAILCLLFSVLTFGLEVISNGTTYKVKGKAIFQDGVDITSTLTVEQENEIRTILDEQVRVEKEVKKAEQAQKKAEKAQKKAEKNKNRQKGN